VKERSRPVRCRITRKRGVGDRRHTSGSKNVFITAPAAPASSHRFTRSAVSVMAAAAMTMGCFSSRPT
jgi:hypothetical protein